jgi:hypothetical protein
MSQEIPPVATLVIHRVADWEAFKRAFDEHRAARKEASILGHHVNRGADDPNMVYIYTPASDVNRLRAFIDSAGLGDAMKKATVKDEPDITFMTPMSADFIPDQMLPGMIVKHEVRNYDRWRAAYDDFDTHRRQVGIIGHAVNQELGNANNVILYHQADDLGTLRAFVESAELREAMARAGVVGEPEIHFVQVADFADY